MKSQTRTPNLTSVLEVMATTEAVFSRTQSVAELIERLLGASAGSVDAALYRFNSQRLARALDGAQQRGVRIRLVIDRNKYEESAATRRLLSEGRFPFRLTYGRDSVGSKMHHKFVVVDDAVVLTGSYNWTLASEEKNYDNLLALKELRLIERYRKEFEALWDHAEPPPA